VSQVVEHLLCKLEVLSSNSSPTKRKEKKSMVKAMQLRRVQKDAIEKMLLAHVVEHLPSKNEVLN
jgi:hypothetical protein